MQIGPKRSMYPPQQANANTMVDTLLGYSTDYSGQRVATVERVMPVRAPCLPLPYPCSLSCLCPHAGSAYPAPIRAFPH